MLVISVLGDYMDLLAYPRQILSNKDLNFPYILYYILQ